MERVCHDRKTLCQTDSDKIDRKTNRQTFLETGERTRNTIEK